MITFFAVSAFIFGTVIPSLGISFWYIYRGNYDTSKWFLPCPIILPVDNTSPFGWYCELFLQTISGYQIVLTISSNIAFFGGCTFYIEAGLQRFKYIFDKLDRKVAAQLDSKAIEEDIFDAIVFHNKLLDIFDKLSKIYSAAIFFHLICNILFLRPLFIKPRR